MRSKFVAMVAGLAVAGLYAGVPTAQAANLVVNGDFSAGNTGFSTEYTLTTMTPYLFQNGVHGIYAVEPAGSIAGSSVYGDWTNISTDPSGGNGNVYVADGATTADTTVWSQTVAVSPDTNYVFSFYGAEVSNPCCSNAVLQPSVDGTDGTALDATASWQQQSMTWYSGSNTTATLSLVDLNLSAAYNDFTIDDLAFSPTATVPEPTTAALLALGIGLLGMAVRRRGTRLPPR